MTDEMTEAIMEQSVGDQIYCTQNLIVVAILFFSLLFFMILFFLMSVSLPFVNSVQLYIYLLICNKSSSSLAYLKPQDTRQILISLYFDNFLIAICFPIQCFQVFCLHRSRLCTGSCSRTTIPVYVRLHITRLLSM